MTAHNVRGLMRIPISFRDMFARMHTRNEQRSAACETPHVYLTFLYLPCIIKGSTRGRE